MIIDDAETERNPGDVDATKSYVIEELLSKAKSKTLREQAEKHTEENSFNNLVKQANSILDQGKAVRKVSSTLTPPENGVSGDSEEQSER